MSSTADNAVFGCVWDNDGVLVDSLPAHFAAFQDAAAERGTPFTWEQFRITLGQRTDEVLNRVWGITDPAEIEYWGNYKDTRFRAQADKVRAMPGAAELVRALHAAGWKQAVGSAGPKENVELLISVIGLRDYFDGLVSGADVTQGKPDPQIFNTAMGKLGLPASRCIVIEDAMDGVRAGKASGAFTIGLTSTSTREQLSASGADLVVDSLFELTPEMLAGFLAGRQGV